MILKQQKPKWDDGFENKKLMHARLRPLQGSVIPVFFGGPVPGDQRRETPEVFNQGDARTGNHEMAPALRKNNKI